jgi:hypothetical protein
MYRIRRVPLGKAGAEIVGRPPYSFPISQSAKCEPYAARTLFKFQFVCILRVDKDDEQVGIVTRPCSRSTSDGVIFVCKCTGSA